MSSPGTWRSGSPHPQPVFRGVWCLVWIGLLLAAGPVRGAALPYAEPRFTDPQRRQKIQATLPELDQSFRDFAEAEHLPGLVYGVVVDGELVHHAELGRPTGSANYRPGRARGFASRP